MYRHFDLLLLFCLLLLLIYADVFLSKKKNYACIYYVPSLTNNDVVLYTSTKKERASH